MSHPNRTTLDLEALGDRVVPAVIDLTTAGASGVASGAIVEQVSPQPTGTGYIRSFVRVHASGVQQGFNTDARPLQHDENSSPQFTRSLALGQVPVVTVNGVNYREFLLDINQKASAPLLSLDQVKVYLGTTGNATSLASLGAAVYDLDAAGDNTVKLNARLTSGSGSGDMRLLIPEAAFAGRDAGSFVYLYSKFGGMAGAAANGGFEEWAVRAAPPAVPQAPPPPPTGRLSGKVVLDLDRDGALTEAERNTGIAGVTIELRVTGADGLTRTVGFRTTAADGSYSFDGLAAGTYTVIQTQPPQWGDGADFVGTGGGAVTGGQTAEGFSNDAFKEVVLAAGQVVTDYIFAEVGGVISGTVTQDGEGDPVPRAGVRVTLVSVDAQGNRVVVGETFTVEDGSFSFAALAAGNYLVLIDGLEEIDLVLQAGQDTTANGHVFV
ncbi:MAG: hypothetical protein C0501_13475 [Isosphaera sp.]|nr:hypothetical protein [Isosphaera sp.]